MDGVSVLGRSISVAVQEGKFKFSIHEIRLLDSGAMERFEKCNPKLCLYGEMVRFRKLKDK